MKAGKIMGKNTHVFPSSSKDTPWATTQKQLMQEPEQKKMNEDLVLSQYNGLTRSHATNLEAELSQSSKNNSALRMQSKQQTLLINTFNMHRFPDKDDHRSNPRIEHLKSFTPTGTHVKNQKGKGAV
jgi:hypothetical protein